MPETDEDRQAFQQAEIRRRHRLALRAALRRGRGMISATAGTLSQTPRRKLLASYWQAPPSRTSPIATPSRIPVDRSCR
jgi:hypothetical protein